MVTSRVVVVGLFLGTCIGCGAERGGDSTPDAFAAETEALYGGGDVAWLWPGAGTTAGATIPVCFEIGSDTGTVEANGSSIPVNGLALEAIVRSAAAIWSQAANLHFTGFGVCPSRRAEDNAATVAVHWEFNGGAASTTYGYQPTQWTRMRLNPSSNKFGVDALHEFGHAIGFAHEMERPDNWDANGDAVFCGHTDGDKKALVGGTAFTQAFDDKSIMSYCAEDNGQNTLSPGDIAGVQLAYGRKPSGSIVAFGSDSCVDIPLTNGTFTAGTQVQLYQCNAGDNQKWQRNSSLQLFAAQNPTQSYLDVAGNATGDHGIVQVYTKKTPATPNQQWSFNGVQVLGYGFQCVFAPSAGLTNNTVLQLGSCGNSNVAWTVNPSGSSGTIQQSGFCWDVPFGTATNGAVVQVFQCNGGNAQKFTLSSTGQIKFGTKCVEMSSDNQRLKLATCNTQVSDVARPKQLFNLRGPITTIGGNCLDDPNGDTSNNTLLQTYHCTGASNQRWDYYFN